MNLALKHSFEGSLCNVTQQCGSKATKFSHKEKEAMNNSIQRKEQERHKLVCYVTVYFVESSSNLPPL